jgi:hypothetical protein
MASTMSAGGFSSLVFTCATHITWDRLKQLLLNAQHLNATVLLPQQLQVQHRQLMLVICCCSTWL